MKKILFFLAASAAVLAGCSKSELDVNNEDITTPVVVPAKSFVATFALNDRTKTTVVESSDAYSVRWEMTDLIEVKYDGGEEYYDFKVKSVKSGSTQAEFVAVDEDDLPDDFFDDGHSYEARFGTDGATEFTQEGEGSARHIVMEASSNSARELNFEVTRPVLAVKIPEGVSADKVSVTPRNGGTTYTVTGSSSYSEFFIPVPAGSGEYFISAWSGSNEIAESMKMQGSQTLAAGQIYPMEFTPTLEISEAGSYELKSFPANYRVKILAACANVTIEYASGASENPANVYLDAKSHAVTSLVVDTPASHFEVANGSSTHVTSKTSNSTFVIKPTYTITTATVQEGSITAEGKAGGSRNVEEIVLAYPTKETMTGTLVSVAEVTTGSPVVITNSTEYKEDNLITVVGVDNSGTGKPQDEGGYTIDNNNNVQKVDEVVAKIGDSYYATLKAAVDGATDGDTIILVNDETTTSQVTVKKSVDINLNGHTYTITKDEKDDSYAIEYDGYDASPDHSVRISGKVYGGTVISKRTAIYACDHADLTVENVTVLQSEDVSGRSTPNCAVAASYGSTLTVKSGSYTGNNAAGVFTTGGIINVEGGTLTGTEHAFIIYAPSSSESESNSELHVSGGQISGDCSLPDGKPYGSFERIISYTGGIFNPRPDDSFAATGYTISGPSSGWYTVELAEPVAMIGSTSFATLEAAFAAVKDGETITLVGDCETGSEYTEDDLLALTEPNVTLDLNGKTVTETNNFSWVIAGDNDVVKNGKIVAGYNEAKTCKYHSYALVVGAKGEDDVVTGVKIQDVEITGGVSIGGSLEGKPAAYKGSAQSTEMENCTVAGGDWYAICVQSKSSSVTIKSGEYNHSTAGSQYATIFSKYSGCTISLTGGTYSKEPLAAYVADGYSAVAQGTDPETWTVEKVAAQIGDTKYATLDEAIEAVQSGQTIQLLSDIDYGEFSDWQAITVADGKNFTLDLAGKTISGTATRSGESKLILIQKGATLTVKDSGSNGTITYESTQPDPGWWYGTYTIDNQGTFNLESGSIVNTTDGGASYAVENHCNHTSVDVVFNMSGGALQCDEGDQALRLYGNNNTGKCKVNITGGEIVSGGIWINDQTAGSTGGCIELNISGTADITGKLDFIGSHDHTVINVSGGTFTCPTLRLRNTQSYSNTKPYANISGGDWTITTIQNENAGGVKTNTLTLTGGTYNSNMDGFVADGYEAVANGTTPETWTVQEKQVVSGTATITAANFGSGFSSAINVGDKVFYLKLTDQSYSAGFDYYVVSGKSEIKVTITETTSDDSNRNMFLGPENDRKYYILSFENLKDGDDDGGSYMHGDPKLVTATVCDEDTFKIFNSSTLESVNFMEGYAPLPGGGYSGYGFGIYKKSAQ